MITVGEITGVHGVKGYIKIRSFADSPDMFAPGMKFFLGNFYEISGLEKSKSSANRGDWYKVVSATPHKKGIIALFEGVNREIAETLVGKTIYVSKDELPELEPDTFYWHDLVGLKVTDINSGYLGVIDHVIPTGSNDVFVVKPCDKALEKHNHKNQNDKEGEHKEILIPALSWVVLSVDLDNREMIVDLPPGLK